MSLVTLLSRTCVTLVAALLAAGPTVAVAAPTPAPAGTPAPPTPGPAATRWAVQPSGPDGPTGRNYFIYDLAPGSTLTDHVGVTNLSDRPLTFQVYGTDAYTTADGAFALLPADRAATDVGSWVRFDRRTWTIAPGRRADIPFRLSVPANATPGDHAGGVIAAITQARTTADGQQVRVDQRLAARVYLRVDGDVRPAVAIESVSVSYDNPINPAGGGDAVVSYRVRNTGNVRVGGTGTVAVEGPFGWRLARTAPVDLPELLPGGVFTVTERVTGVPPALRLTAEVDLAPTTVDAALPPVLRSASTWAPPWLLLAALAVLAGCLAVRLRRRALAKRGAGDTSARDTAADPGRPAGSPATRPLVGPAGDAP
ncbi:WxL protein peptidoglycan domain-containing protein [Micromonospora sp. LOL_025]|uniref:WxL protein peptidoglycan domain-containing protein n=1 Tax=Micromonospora sp. LOL_025 TaxID=3345413 RepID=UPI003A8494B5